MSGPGAYRPDPSEGITRPADLPQPQMIYSCRDAKRHPCPRCGYQAYRDKRQQRTLHDLGDRDAWCPRDLVVTYAQHSCTKCRTYFSIDLSDLFDRRCRTQTALHKLDNLRRRLLRFTQLGEPLKKLFSPTLEKALTFLDDTLFPSTSHAVERGNRRYRKRQKQVYRVRTQAQIRARLALDMWREAQGEGRHQTLNTFHAARAG